MAERRLRVAVLMGGPSSEYEISLNTGKKILSALDPEKYLVQPVVVTKERRWLAPPIEAFRLTDSNTGADTTVTALAPYDEAQAIEEMKGGGVDVAFIAMHGEFGEDGTLQGLLESVSIPYTGSGVLASALGMDKPRSAAVFRQVGLRVPDFFTVSRRGWHDSESQILKGAQESFGLPLVIKPANLGSSVGASIAFAEEDTGAGIEAAFTHASIVILQRYIPGTEVSCGVLETETGLTALPPTEIVPRESRFFDYHAKYAQGGSDEITPARLPAAVIHRIQQAALAAHQAIGGSGFSRTDMIIDRAGTLWVLEINTIPGLSEASILPKQAQAMGIPFPKLLDAIIAAALRKRRHLA